MNILRLVCCVFVVMAGCSRNGELNHNMETRNIHLSNKSDYQDYVINKNTFYGIDFSKSGTIYKSFASKIVTDKATGYKTYISPDPQKSFSTISICLDEKEMPAKLSLTKVFNNEYEAREFFNIIWSSISEKYPADIFYKNFSNGGRIIDAEFFASIDDWQRKQDKKAQYKRKFPYSKVMDHFPPMGINRWLHKMQFDQFKVGEGVFLVTVEYQSHRYRRKVVSYRKEKKKKLGSL